MREVRASDILEELLELSGKRVLDVGCGNGHLTRLMTQRGARTTGLDSESKQIAKARAEAMAGDEDYIEAKAQSLPFEDLRFDIVVFFNSLHHIPAEMLGAAIREAWRVLKKNGILYVSEPLAEGAYFELGRPVNDESELRQQAYEAVLAAGKSGFRLESEVRFLHPMAFKSFEDFRTRIVSANHEREALVESMAARLEAEFERLGQKTERGWLFLQPTRVNLLRKEN